MSMVRWKVTGALHKPKDNIFYIEKFRYGRKSYTRLRFFGDVNLPVSTVNVKGAKELYLA